MAGTVIPAAPSNLGRNKRGERTMKRIQAVIGLAAMLLPATCAAACDHTTHPAPSPAGS